MSARPGVAQMSHTTAKPAVPTDWMRRRICDTSIDFCSDNRDEIARAKAICIPCPVQQECLAYALARSETTGVYGGLSADERAGLFLRWKTFRRRELPTSQGQGISIPRDELRSCRDCGTEFDPQHHLSRYCSNECRDRSRSANSRVYEARHRQKRRSEREASAS
ncbi:transcriptional regulator [Mycolicibacterium conceptionense]|uniref:Transcriptional regulator n=2 Tax=Mycolicibacterium conceptionense TaxID=451644 RepID=A0A0U1DZ66_9MYCO|nr:hypothetical protein AWB98_29205 [Mycolicibacterium conceptionense]CQD15851.1 transcriptional regulator [Mycolicibacterium conceptionense]CQD25321.1 transcriptional regulator [Mycolicibacterium conceptionense]